MVFLHFPSNLTDEELNLQAKYMKLRKKKKQLQEFTKPKAEPEKSSTLKRSLDPKEATELAKKLVISGKISVGLGKGQEQKTVFKRPSGLEKKLTESKVPTAIATKLPNYSTNTPTTSFNSPGASTSTSPSTSSLGGPGPSGANANATTDIGYTPFTSSTFNTNKKFKQTPTAVVTPIRKVDQAASSESHAASAGNEVEDDQQPGPSSAIPSTSPATSYGGSTPRGARGGGRGLGYNRYEANNGPKPGHTVHVKASGGNRKFTEEICREIFSRVGGTIVNITMELERNCGFVTFDKIELAEKAILDLDKSFQRDNILLSVSFARRQPPLSDLCNDPAPSVHWTHLATNQSQKSSHHDKRAAIVYPDEEVI